MEKKKGFFEGSFGKFVLPGIILQSVMIGGGYATGREIVEYGAKYGALGWLSGLGTFLGFAVIAALTYELIHCCYGICNRQYRRTNAGIELLGRRCCHYSGCCDFELLRLQID